MKVKTHLPSRFAVAVQFPDGRIFRHSKSASKGGKIFDRWGFVPEGTKETCGWGTASFEWSINSTKFSLREINDNDLKEIIEQAESGEEPEVGSAADWYMNHVPYWQGTNREYSDYLEIAKRAEQFITQQT